MPKKQHGRGRGRQPQRRHARPAPSRTGPGQHAEDQDLFQSLRRTLRSGEPLEFLATVSGLMEVTDPRNAEPIPGHERRPTLQDLVESFAGTPYAETTAALTAIRALTADELLAARIGKELESRRHPLPEWLSVLDQARLDPDVWFLTHVLGDGDDYLLGVVLPTGEALSALVYVDHNMGTVVKDAFVVPEPLEDLALKVGTLMEDPDQSLTRTDPATARGVVEAAIDAAALRFPPLTSDSWPMCRPLVEWMVRMLPPAARDESRDWSEEELAEVADDFFASPYGTPLDDTDCRRLLEVVLLFCTEHATGDPWRWSPVTVEMLLADWFPRAVVAELPFLAQLPDLVRAYIRYCHDRLGIRSDLTSETLAAVDLYEPVYLSQIVPGTSPATADLIESLLHHARGGKSQDEWQLDRLAEEVGGMEVLDALDDDPLPDEDFDWTGIDESIRPMVQVMLDTCDDCAEELFDVEHRTAMRRVLARAARNDPKVFQRKASPVRGAAAMTWLVGRVNRTVGPDALPATDLLAYFRASGSVSDRAQTLCRAAGYDVGYIRGDLRLGDPEILVSGRRRELIEARDRIRAAT